MKIIPGYDRWSELDLLAGVIIGEARGESTAGMIGVAMTIKTRVDHPCWWGRNWREVILADKQFSCWQDINASVIKECFRLQNSLWKICRGIAADVYLGNVVDAIGQPTHYHSAAIHPDWAAGMKRLCMIGKHIFFRDTSQIGE